MGWLLLSPTLLILFVFGLLPFIYVVGVGFHRWNAFAINPNPTYYGLDNYRRLVFDDRFLHSVQITLQFTTYAVLAQLILQLLNHLLQLPNGFSLLLDMLNQVAHQLDNSVLALSANGSNFFVTRQLYDSHLITAAECWPYSPRFFDGVGYSSVTVALVGHLSDYGRVVTKGDELSVGQSQKV